ncbi:prepilin-type N-terminal cleavage/methylation domain-containing protein [Candidatus Sumerlaeota bacterium]|nr:prepilin-type N-terminal cleavage/methylation domain-containing protein [Candidatus Sumerlaeota bacterium]MBI3737217.1 prepilin-type N-terminal cleavage/methylation domain-containing protein [Candidatus Sumerlaeota bacterium]
MRAHRGFTLIELLVVVAIIAVLAAIAVPNFLEARVRAQVTRVKADMRSLATAVESYQVDHSAYPYRQNVINANLKPGTPEAGNRLAQLSVITTPIAYITSLPTDVFEHYLTPPNVVIDYWDPVQTSWLINYRFPLFSPFRIKEGEAPYILVSPGPDGYLGAITNNYGWPYPNSNPLAILGTVYVIYDPTNGTNSIGNIYSGSQGPDSTAAYLHEHFWP